MENPNQKVCLLILGMHRSGTSALTRAVNLLGYTLPDKLIPAGEGNSSGHWEPENIVMFNERLLDDMQSTWADFRAFSASSLSPAAMHSVKSQISTLLQEEYKGAKNIVVKDPRVCRFSSLYINQLEEIGYRVVPIIAFRSPAEVINSLRKRESVWPPELGGAHAALLWLRHFLDAELGSRDMQRTFVNYASVISDWQTEVQRLAEQGGFLYPEDVSETAPLIEEFLRPDLRNQHEKSDDFSGRPILRGWCMKVHHAAQRLVVNPHSETAQAQLDEVRGELERAELFISDFADESMDRFRKLMRDERTASQHLSTLQEAYDETHQNMVGAKQRVEGQDRQIKELNNELTLKRQRVEGQDRQIKELNGQLTNYKSDVERMLSELRELEQSFLNSRSWRLTAPVRGVGSAARSLKNSLRAFRQASAAKGGYLRGSAVAARILVTEGRSGFQKRLHDPVLFGERPKKSGPSGKDPRRCFIAATPHVMNLAHMLGRVLREEGFSVDIGVDLNGSEFAEHVFVFCPQMFASVPEDCIVIQMEQSVSSRWFATEYLDTLKNARAVIDYSKVNIQFLKEQGVPPHKIFYVPIDVDRTLLAGGAKARKSILFYGDDNTPRRQRILEAVGEAFPQLRIVNDLFGDELAEELCQAAVVLNIHYYEGALLETTRVYQALSYGTPVVSERSVDQTEHEELEQLVDFADIDDVDSIISLIREYVENDEYSKARRQKIAAFTQKSRNRFEDSVRRFLLAQNMTSYDGFCERAPEYPLVPSQEPKLCLSLPETPDRRAQFVSLERSEFQIWDGLKSNPAWIGAALSYRHMFQKLSAANVQRATVCEDDVIFPGDFERRMEIVERYLAKHDWDIFSGFIADSHKELQITHVEEFEGQTFAHIDRTVSMVFNIYNREIIDYLSSWKPDNIDVETNTIDRYLENRADTKVIVALPFLVRHRTDTTSTVWGFHNSQYDELIKESEMNIAQKVSEFTGRPPESYLSDEALR